jgi:hypothetical protein
MIISNTRGYPLNKDSNKYYTTKKKELLYPGPRKLPRILDNLLDSPYC